LDLAKLTYQRVPSSASILARGGAQPRLVELQKRGIKPQSQKIPVIFLREFSI
jgi:hypothetical protein